MTSADTPSSTPTAPRRWAANRLGLDYRAEAERLGKPVVPIIDGHAHINGGEASRVYRDVMDLFGVEAVMTQTQLAQAEAVKSVLGERVHFVAVPEYMSPDQRHAHTEGYIENITRWHELGARMLKFWCAPRGRDYGKEMGDASILTLDNPWRRKQMDHAASLGMMFMAHIADPDTWFATKYTDAPFYGTKLDQYEPLERLADEYNIPWLIAHLGGWPEDLDFVAGLLERHPQFVIDTSATKWMVRELSKHPSDEFLAFLRRFEGRVFFGSDIVTLDEHLSADDGPRKMGAAASSPEDAFQLYASRYWAYRTMFETGYEGESPIADPDLMLVDPEQHDEMSAPTLKGHRLPADVQKVLYREAAENSILRWYREHA
jgi:hypothetical protein